MVGKEKIQVVLEYRDHSEWGRYWRVWPSLQMGAYREKEIRRGGRRKIWEAQRHVNRFTATSVLTCREGESWKISCQDVSHWILEFVLHFLKNNFFP